MPHSTRFKLSCIVFGGIVIRELLAPFTGHPFDFEIWLRLGYYVSLGQDPYNNTFPVPLLSMPGSGYLPSIGYPPIWPLFLAGIYKVYAFIGYNNRFFYYFLLKQPMVACDIIDGLLLYSILGSSGVSRRIKGDVTGFRAAAFWFFCPFTIIISSVWGMFDQIILTLLLLSVIALSKTVRSSLSMALGILLKLLPLIYLLLFSFAQSTKKKIVEYLSISLLVSGALTLLPYLFFPSWSVSRVFQTGASVAGTVGNSMNYWVVVYVFNLKLGAPSYDYPILQLLSFVWIPFVFLACVFCIRTFNHSLKKTENLTLSILFVTLVFFLTRSQINEQYLIYFLGFGLLDYYLIGQHLRRVLFHAIWIDSLGFLVANNTFLVRFLDPISPSYRSLDESLTTGFIGDLRLGIMVVTGLVFTVLCAMYLWSLYHEMRAKKDAEKERKETEPSGSLFGATTTRRGWARSKIKRATPVGGTVFPAKRVLLFFLVSVSLCGDDI